MVKHNLAAVLENDTHKFEWGFDMQTDHLISTRKNRPYSNKKKTREHAKLSSLLYRLTTEKTERK